MQSLGPGHAPSLLLAHCRCRCSRWYHDGVLRRRADRACAARSGRGPPPAVTDACALWVERDARRHNVFFPTDWGLYALVAWPLLIPWYAWRTRRRARWRVILGLYGAMLAPYVIAMWALLLYHALAKQRAVPDRAPEEGHVTLVLPPLS